jgi:hypothetical protein
MGTPEFAVGILDTILKKSPRSCRHAIATERH